MKKEITYCDVCGKEGQIMTNKIQVTFTTEQTEGRSVKPYLSTPEFDICKACKQKTIDGQRIYGSGAQGHNKYEFKELSEIQELRHFRDTVIGLWATDKPDRLTDEEKDRCQLFQIV